MVCPITASVCSNVTTEEQHLGTQEQTATMWLLNFFKIMQHQLMKAIITYRAKDLRVQCWIRLTCTWSACIYYSLVCRCRQIHRNYLQYVKSNIMTRLLSVTFKMWIKW